MSGRLSWPLCGFSVLCLIAGLGLYAGHPDADPLVTVLTVLDKLMLAGIAVVGAVVASRLPANPCGWLVAVIAASFAITISADELYETLVRSGPVEGGARFAPWLESWIWIPAMLAVATFPQVFPTGRPLRGRWSLLLRTGAAAGPLMFAGTAFAQGRIEDYPDVQNPVGIGGAAGAVIEIAGSVGFALFVITVLGAIASLVVRWRRSAGIERQQLKWVATAAVSFPVAFALPTDEVAGEELGFTLLLLSLFLVALAVAVAVLRHRLYDIDVVIRRTLVYTGLTATLVGAYLVTVLFAQLVLPARSDLGVALSTLAAAAAFTPARRRIQALVDRRFFRSRFDAQRTLETFGAHLRDEVDLDALSTELQGVVAQTMQPAHVSLWLR